jgi:hypothetical protein
MQDPTRIFGISSLNLGKMQVTWSYILALCSKHVYHVQELLGRNQITGPQGCSMSKSADLTWVTQRCLTTKHYDLWHIAIKSATFALNFRVPTPKSLRLNTSQEEGIVNDYNSRFLGNVSGPDEDIVVGISLPGSPHLACQTCIYRMILPGNRDAQQLSKKLI